MEVMDISSEFLDYDGYMDFEPESENLGQVWNGCVIFSVFSVVPLITKLVLSNLVFGWLLSAGYVPKQYLHILGGCIGVFLLIALHNSANLILFAIFIFSLMLLRISILLGNHMKSTNFLICSFITFLVLCEYGLIEPVEWLQMRGIVMVLVMKMISLGDDCEKNLRLPSFVELFGYTFSGANVLFGPWVPFHEYLTWFDKPTKKNSIFYMTLLQVLVLSLVFLTISNCWSEYLIGNDLNRWFVAYREALSFRTSHYFISFLAEAGMIAAGFTNTLKCDSLKNSYRYIITQPFSIEFPSSLADVIRKWNSPMHAFLKKYIYKSCLKYGKFAAILVTFLLSSLLHGFESKVSMVLINLGIFSYMQVIVRDKIAAICNCCSRIRPCTHCDHKNKRNSLMAKSLLLLCTFSTVFHLAYLGVLMDPSTDQIGIFAKWKHLYFVSHVLLLLYLVILK